MEKMLQSECFQIDAKLHNYIDRQQLWSDLNKL